MSGSAGDTAFHTLFHEDTILLGLEVEEKNDVLGKLVDVMVEAGRIPEKKRKSIVDALVGREGLGSTGIGAGIAIPHVKTDDVDKTVTAVAVSARPIDFKAVDGEPCDLFFLLLSPKSQAEKHLEILRWLSRLVRDGDFCRFMRSAKDPGEAAKLFQEFGE